MQIFNLETRPLRQQDFLRWRNEPGIRGIQQGADKRGGKFPGVNLDDIADIRSERARELMAFDDVLNALAEIDPRKARVIELRFFGVSAFLRLRSWFLCAHSVQTTALNRLSVRFFCRDAGALKK